MHTQKKKICLVGSNGYENWKEKTMQTSVGAIKPFCRTDRMKKSRFNETCLQRFSNEPWRGKQRTETSNKRKNMEEKEVKKGR